jgi:hypothetical protein
LQSENWLRQRLEQAKTQDNVGRSRVRIGSKPVRARQLVQKKDKKEAPGNLFT